MESGAAMCAVRQVFVLSYLEKPDPASLPALLQTEGKCRFIPIPTAVQEKWRLDGECCLLMENLEDGNFYHFIARHYCWNQNIPIRRIHFHSELGGGNTICDVLKKCVSKEKTPVLCLVDSDRKHGVTKSFPNPPATGGTLDRAQKVSDELSGMDGLPPHCLFALHVHEIENLIPLQLMEALKPTPAMHPGLAIASRLRQVRGGEPLLYYDFKKGFPYIKGKPGRAYWGEILQELGGDEASMPAGVKLKPGTYQPELLFFPPLSCNLLRNVLGHIQAAEQNHEPIHETLRVDDYLKAIWDDVGIQMLTWGYASEPMRA